MIKNTKTKTKIKTQLQISAHSHKGIIQSFKVPTVSGIE